MNVKIPIWAVVGFLCVILALGFFVGRRNSNLRDNVERLQTGIQAARDSQQILVGQLGQLSIDYIGIESELKSAIVELDNSREQVGRLKGQIEDSKRASNLIGESVENIGKFIEEVDRLNEEREN